MPISLILTTFYHFHFRPTLGLLSSQDLTYCLMLIHISNFTCQRIYQYWNRVHPSLKWLNFIVQYLIIFSNKWLYLNISRTLQIHDQGDSHNLLSVGWSFKMANTWSLINATWGNAQHLLFLLWTIEENGWFFFNQQEWLILVFLSTRFVDSTQTENQHSGRCMQFWNYKFPFWRWETTKWVTESTKCEPLSTKWVTETWN